jgi:hypothetical protein
MIKILLKSNNGDLSKPIRALHSLCMLNNEACAKAVTDPPQLLIEKCPESESAVVVDILHSLFEVHGNGTVLN